MGIGNVGSVTEALNNCEASVRKALGQQLCEKCGHQQAVKTYSFMYWCELNGEAEKDVISYAVCRECYDKYYEKDKAWAKSRGGR